MSSTAIDVDVPYRFYHPRFSIVSEGILNQLERHGRTRRTSRFFINNSLEPAQEGIDILAEVDHIFIRQALPEQEDDILESSHLYELLDISGNIIFTAVKTFHYENCDKLLEFDLTVLEHDGGGFLSIKGDSEHISICTLSFGGTLKEQIGSIYCPQTNKCSKKGHRLIFVRDSQNCDKFFLTPNRPRSNSKKVKNKARGEYKILTVSDNTVTTGEPVNCGKTSKSWPEFLPGDHPQLSKLFGVTFKMDTEAQSKVLLLASFLLLYLQTYDSNHNLRKGVCSGFQGICCTLFSSIMCFLMVILVIGILIYTTRNY